MDSCGVIAYVRILRVLLGVWLAGCTASKNEASLVLVALPGTPLRIKATATNGDGSVGVGKVRFASAAGSFDADEVTLDSFGTASSALVCQVTSEPACAASFQVTATWIADDVQVEASARVPASAPAQPGDGGAVQTADAGPPPLFDAKVLISGSLTRAFCSFEGIADPRRPAAPQVAFDCTQVTRAVWANGVLYYTLTATPGLRKFRPDAWDRMNGGSQYPSPDKSPDDRRFEDCGPINSFFVSPGGQILHDCPSRGVLFYFVDGVQTTLAFGINSVKAISEGGAVLRSDDVVTADGVVHPLSTVLRFSISVPVAEGFLVAVSNSTNQSICDLKRVTFDGVVTHMGSFQTSCVGKLDADSKFTQIGTSTVVESLLNGSSSTIYTGNSTGTDLSVFPPRLFLDAFQLVGAN